MSRTFELKDKIILTSWVFGLLVLIFLVWVLSQPLQINYLLRTINGVLINTGDSRRLVAHDQSRAETGFFGYWYTMHNTTDKMLVFSVFQDGIIIPLGAVVSNENKVEEIIPLSLHARQIFNTLPQSVLQIYINRIETAAFSSSGGRNK